MNGNAFYIYVIFRSNGVPCYVGKGKGRRWREHFRKCLNPHLAAIIKQAGGDLPVVLVHTNLTEPQAFEYERAFIAAIGREAHGGPLVNVTDGGEGPSGLKQSYELRAHKRAIMLRPELRESARQRAIGNTNRRGSKQSPETIEKTRLANIGRKQSAEEKEKRAAKNRSKKRSAEFCQRMRDLKIGIKKSDSARRKMSLAKSGKKHSEDHRRSISESIKLHWETRRAQ